MDKKRIKAAVWAYECRIAAIIVEGVNNRASKRDILNRCRKEIVNYKLSDAEKNQLWVWVNSFYKRIIVAARREIDSDKRSELIYSVVKGEIKRLEHVKNEIADEVEYRLKHKELVDLLSDDSNKFYYCTVHANPAEGHAAYQGKIYYREELWDSYSDKEKKYISDHELLSVESVLLEPVYLCTRRNCRHRLIPLGKKNNDSKNIKEMSYEEIQYRAYLDRLKYLERIKKSGFVNPELDKDIKETRKLVKKWYDGMKKVRE